MPREDHGIVRVSTRSRAALSKPTFVIEKDGVLYLTLAVLAYDPDAADTEEEKEGVSRMRQLFAESHGDRALPSAEVEFGPRLMRLVQTNPRDDEEDEF